MFGIQGDYDWSNASGTATDALNIGLTDRSSIKSLASVTGRVGYAWDRFLGYVKGGGAWVRDDYGISCFATASETRTGWTVGVGGEYAFTDAWKLGADLNVFGSQYLIHDDSNLNPKVPAYWVVNMHTSYQVTKNVQIFGLVQNLFNQHYYSAGTFFSTAGFNNSTPGGPNVMTFNDPRTFLPGMPLAVYAGLKATF